MLQMDDVELCQIWVHTWIVTQGTSCDKPASWSWCYQEADAVRDADKFEEGVELLTLTSLLMPGPRLGQVAAMAQAHDFVHGECNDRALVDAAASITCLPFCCCCHAPYPWQSVQQWPMVWMLSEDQDSQKHMSRQPLAWEPQHCSAPVGHSRRE